MNKVALAKNISTGEEMIIMPRNEYEKFCSAYEKVGWLEKEREADRDILAGRVSQTYRTKKELKTALDKLKK